MPTSASRRRFLRALLTIAGAAGIAGCGPAAIPASAPPAEPDAPGPPLATIAEMLRAEFAYLDLSAIDLEGFAREFRQRGDRKLLAAWDSDPAWFADTLGSQFLMSTDFFWHAADETRQLQYRRYFDLYEGCQSPFAQLG